MSNQFINLSVLVFLVLILLVSILRLYYDFLNFRRNKWTLILPLVAISSFGLIIWITASNNPALNFLLALVFICLSLILFLKLRVPKCDKKEKMEELEGVEIYLCQTKVDYSNAWYNVKDKAIYVTERFIKILDKDELRIVLKHELGHKNQKALLILRSLAVTSSLSFFSFVVLVWFFAFLSPRLVVLYIEMVLLFIIISISSSIILWIDEHEADKNSVNSLKDLEKFATALIKMHMDRFSTHFKPFVEIRVEESKNLLKLNLDVNYNFQEFVKDFISYFAKVLVFSVLDLMHREIIITHPPTRFRILYLIRALKENGNGVKALKT